MTFGPEPRKLPSAAEVVRSFEAEGFSPEGYTLYAYAAVQVFAEAARRAGSTGLAALEKALYAGAYETVLGPVTFDDKGDVRGFEYSMYRWHMAGMRKSAADIPVNSEIRRLAICGATVAEAWRSYMIPD